LIRSSTPLNPSMPRIERSLNASLGNMVGAAIKRAFDFGAALCGLLVLSPVFVLIAILIKRDTPGPIFYRGPRLGQSGRVFRMLKFRTMYERPRSYRGRRVTGKDDDRVTPVGKWLRATKLNELPQLWNVLIGEMSLVGPRPEDPSIAKTWPLRIARELLSVRPGITSPASVLYRDEESMLGANEVMRKYLHELSPDKMRLDQLYIRYRSFWLDLDVMLWTAILLLPRIKAYSPPELLLFVGPVTRLMERYVGWFILDFLVVFASFGLIGMVIRLFGPLNMGEIIGLEVALGYSVLFSIVGMVSNMNGIKWPKATFWDWARLWATWFVVTAIALGCLRYFGYNSLRIQGAVLGASVLALAGFTSVRYRERLARGLATWLSSWQHSPRVPRERVLIVGSGRTAEHIARLMDHPTYSRKFKIIGFLDNDLRSQGMRIYGSKVIGQVKDAERIIKEQDIGLIILADSQLAERGYGELRSKAGSFGARVFVAPDVFGALGALNPKSRTYNATTDLPDLYPLVRRQEIAVNRNGLARLPKRKYVTRKLRSRGDRQ
jgi:lipopolysaccharide/colanic/teichoic acid biosynthesis glycosyltransferase